MAVNMVSQDFVWSTAAPESQGLSTPRLDALRDGLAARRTKTFLVIRHDKIVYEWYAPGYGPHIRHYTASLAKALVGGMSLMLALNDGCINIDDAAWMYIPAWKNDPEKAAITIRQLATHSSGIEDASTPGKGHLDQGGWKAAFWRQAWRDWGHDSTGAGGAGESNDETTQAVDLTDPFSIALYRAPVIFSPGTRYAYSNPGMAALAYAVTASLRGAPQSDIHSLLKGRVMDPIGVPEDEWFIGYGKGYEMDGLKLYANWGGGEYTARAAARVGRLMLRKGSWEGAQLVDPDWVEQAVAYAGTPIPDRPAGNPQPGSGLGWWTNFDGVWTKVPRDAFAGAGAGNQILLIVPSLDLIVVRNGELLVDEAQGEGFWGGLEKHLFDPLMDAFVGPPCQPSKVIQSIEFASAPSILRQARGIPAGDGFDGSDNWPLTWADDDNQYTAYGDGYGFAPYTEKKLSLGFAKILGPPTGFRGINIRSESGERLGSGAHGAKASGMLMVDGILYMWVRNTGNAQLAWSGDYGQNWTWSDWRFGTSFGCPTFLNYGKNYAGARDSYVYVYSPDAVDAYTPATHLVLARVPKDRITTRDAYTFFQSLDASGGPVWVDDVQGRGAVFTFPGRCYRCGVSYNAGLGRYLLCQTLPGGDPRFEGGFGIYDAPEPWGPWTMAFFTEKWDVGPGETSSFPTKWMSQDGTKCYLVFSGDDCFSVRRATFSMVESGVKS